jgi:site-specific DNA recombinase
VEIKLNIGEVGAAISPPDPKPLALLAQAHQWFAVLKCGSERSVKSLSRRRQVDAGDMSRISPLAFLAPDIVKAMLDSRQPFELTVAPLKRTNELRLSWARQRETLGFV